MSCELKEGAFGAPSFFPNFQFLLLLFFLLFYIHKNGKNSTINNYIYSLRGGASFKLLFFFPLKTAKRNFTPLRELVKSTLCV